MQPSPGPSPNDIPVPYRPPGGLGSAVAYFLVMLAIGLVVWKAADWMRPPTPRTRTGRFLSKPLRALLDTPVTTCFILALSLFGFWIGRVILTTTVRLPKVQQAGFAGPMSLWPLEVWGWCFIGVGAIGLARAFTQDHPRLDLALHLATMSVVFAWAVAFDVGPQTTGQASYTFVAMISFGTAFIAPLVERRYGRRPPLERQSVESER